MYLVSIIKKKFKFVDFCLLTSTFMHPAASNFEINGHEASV